MTRRLPFLLAALAAAALSTPSALAQVTADAPGIRPDAIVNLASDEGVSLVRGQWRYSDARIVEREQANDLHEAEARIILNAGLALMPVQHVARAVWWRTLSRLPAKLISLGRHSFVKGQEFFDPIGVIC